MRLNESVWIWWITKKGEKSTDQNIKNYQVTLLYHTFLTHNWTTGAFSCIYVFNLSAPPRLSWISFPKQHVCRCACSTLSVFCHIFSGKYIQHRSVWSRDDLLSSDNKATACIIFLYRQLVVGINNIYYVFRYPLPVTTFDLWNAGSLSVSRNHAIPISDNRTDRILMSNYLRTNMYCIFNICTFRYFTVNVSLCVLHSNTFINVIKGIE